MIKRIQTSLDCFTCNGSFMQTEWSDSFQILRATKSMHVIDQIGGILYNLPLTKQGGLSSSTLLMTTSLRLE